MKNCVLLFFFCIIITSSAYSQSLTGSSGLLTIPTADILHDGEIYIGNNFLSQNILHEYGFDHTSITPYVSLGFLPFLELSLRTTYPVDGYEFAATGDRMPGVRIKLFNESINIPSIAIGFHDFLTVFGGSDAVHFNSSYIVLSKNIIRQESIFISSTIGYGSKIMKANSYQFIGVFGGMNIDLIVKKNIFELCLVSEYDGKNINLGSKIKLFNHVNSVISLIGCKNLAGGLSINFFL